MSAPLIQPFTAIRPAPGRAQDIIARPYDVLSSAEAVAGARDRPWSFLHVSRAEVDLPVGTDVHAPEVYDRAAKAFAAMQAEGVLVRDPASHYYTYRMIAADGHVQTGVAAAASTRAYETNHIRRHEHTRPDKELDRARQIAAVGAHTGPVLTAHPGDREVDALLAAATGAVPMADAVTDDGTRHQVWPIVDPDDIDRLTARFEAMPAIYIADGHHRSAAALRVAAQSGGRFLIISFPAEEMQILGYNRIVRDLNGRSPDGFLAEVAQASEVTPSSEPVSPARPGSFGLYLPGQWYALSLREPPAAGVSAVDRLDVSILMARILTPILGIVDPRTDARIDFVGGGRGLADLARRVDDDGWAVAFSLHPTAMADLMAVADAGAVMPPKSTWFEPKLADGLLSLPIER
ncbi:MAG TPA: DUF1015 family protein [Rhodospirillales bacterium]|nr:DUF1015 family protein [Rhodospirillales bacterium]